MDRYISADLAIEKCNKLLENAHSCPNPAVQEGVELVRNLILADCETGVPTADVAPVIHGKWLPAGIFDDLAKCSVCGSMEHSLHEVYSKPHRYCLNCGAKMEIRVVRGTIKENKE